MPTSSLKLIVDWRNWAPDLSPHQRERQTQILYKALRNTDGVSYVQRLYSPQSEMELMGDSLMAEILFVTVTLEQLENFYAVLRQHLPGIPIQIELEANGQKRTMQLTSDRPGNAPSAHSNADQLMALAREMIQS
ncbi:MAG: hypothetical protein ACFB8W_18340 [Elainellaceae cyanobacterium]